VRSSLDKVLQGDPEAVSNFYKTNSPKILKYLLKHLPTKEDAEDLTNDVFFEAIDSLQVLNKESNLDAWLYRIAHNKMVDYYRKKKIKSSGIAIMSNLERFVHLALLPELDMVRARHYLFLGAKILKEVAKNTKNIDEQQIDVSLGDNEIKVNTDNMKIHAWHGDEHFFYCLDGDEWIPCRYSVLAKRGVSCLIEN
jgi:RNA polymerase sigma factor (sigma-70 family)